MNFALNEIQMMLADSIEKFIANEYDFTARQKYSGSETGYSADVWRTFAELGWTAVPFSTQDGGLDGGPVEIMVIMERIGRGLIVEPYLANVILAGGVLKRAANDTQNAEWLRPLINGNLQATLAFTEPHARYEICKVATQAIRNDQHWSLNGCKGFVLNGGNAELLIIPARTSGAEDDPDGITLFGISKDSKGLTFRDYATVDGMRAAEISLDDVRIADSHVIGEVDGGMAALDAAIADATIAVCAEAVGIMTTLTEKTIEYAKQRTQFGVPIGSFQALQHRMVEMYIACEQSRSLLLWAVMSVDDDSQDSRRAVDAIKFQVSMAGTRIGEEAVQIHGGMGMTWELDVAHYFKRLIAISQMFGNADWHLDNLAAGAAK